MTIHPLIVIVGGGIAGLSAAWECHRRQVPVTVVLEATERVGGVIQTMRVDDFVLDAGPDCFLVTKPGAIGLCRELGLADALIPMRTPRGAFVLRNGRLHRLPEGGAFGLPLHAGPLLRSTLLSPAGKLRLALEPLIPCRSGAAGDESAAIFFRRRFGREVEERIAQPLLGGIHAGDLRTLSARAVMPQLVAMEDAGRSVLRGLRGQHRRTPPGGAFRSFRDGVSVLVDTLVACLPSGTVRTGHRATGVTPHGPGWTIQLDGCDQLAADMLVLATPAPVTGALLSACRPAVADLCRGMRAVSTATVLMAYRSAQITHPLAGSGYVTAAGATREPLIATSWLTGKWDGRAPRGHTLLRGFFGGALDEAVLQQSDAELAATAHVSWTRQFGIAGEPVLARVFRWDRSSPQHIVGHLERVRAVERLLAEGPPVAVVGSGFRAIGIPDVISDARSVMAGLLDRWQPR